MTTQEGIATDCGRPTAQGKPAYIALNGYPESGKSEVQRILDNRFGVKPVDDGWPLRAAVMQLYSLSVEDVTTHDGKNRAIQLPDGPKLVRELLGDIGVKVEELHGPDFIPWAAIRSAEYPYRSGAELEAESRLTYDIDQEYQDVSREDLVRDIMRNIAPTFSFGSVRRQQSAFYKKHGGIAIEIIRPGKGKRYEFDEYDRSLCDYTIVNDGDLKDLTRKVNAVIGPYLSESLKTSAA